MLNSFFYLVGQGFKNLWKNRLMSLASIGVLVSCMLLIGIAALLSINISSVVDALEDKSEAVVFLNDDITEEGIESVKGKIMETGKVSSVEFISKDDALRNMMNSMDDDGMLFEAYSKSGENNLPDSFNVKFSDVSKFSLTISKIEQIEGVYSVLAVTEVGDVISGIKRMAYAGGIIIIGLLIVVSLMIIGNTIKITIFSRRREINIMKYVGATNGFIRLPFIVEGMNLGIISGALSFGIIFFAYDYLSKWIASQNSEWFNMIISEIVPFSAISRELLIGFIGGGALIGIFGCVAFMGKHLKV